MLSFDDLIRKHDKSELEQLIIQCIATISSHPRYDHMIPNEIYDKQVEFTKDINY